ncbi:hypothetical protein ACVWWD_001942 [Mesorhizobium sp. URHB0026]
MRSSWARDGLGGADRGDHRKVVQAATVLDEAKRNDRHEADRHRIFPIAVHVRVGEQRRQQLPGLFVDDAANGFAIDPLEQAPRHIRPIGDERAHAFGIEHEVKHVARPFPSGHVAETAEEERCGFVGHQHIPVPVHDQRRIGFMLAQDARQGIGDALHFHGVPGAFGEHRRVACRQKQGIALAQRDIEHPGDRHQGLTAGNAASAFDEADLSLRNSRIEG